MCRNYKDGLCIANNKKCLLGEEGAEAEQGDCELHGKYDVWQLRDKILVSDKGIAPEESKGALGLGIDFLIADELAYRKSKKLKLPVDYL